MDGRKGPLYTQYKWKRKPKIYLFLRDFTKKSKYITKIRDDTICVSRGVGRSLVQIICMREGSVDTPVKYET